MPPLRRYSLWYGGILILGAFDFWSRGVLNRTGGICNSGIAWGIPFPPHLTLLFSLGALSFFLWLWWRERAIPRKIAWMLVLTGGTVNFVERMLSGCVHDYITLPFFPSFNLADMMLSLGIGLILVQTLRRRLKP